jgi:hypothetical protein
MSDFFSKDDYGMCSYPEDTKEQNASHSPDELGTSNESYSTQTSKENAKFSDPYKQNMTLADGSNSGSYPQKTNQNTTCKSDSSADEYHFNPDEPYYDYEYGMSYDPGMSINVSNSSGTSGEVCSSTSASGNKDFDFYTTGVSGGQCTYDPGMSCLTDIPICPHVVLGSDGELNSSNYEPILDVIVVGSDGSQNPDTASVTKDKEGAIYWQTSNASDVEINGEKVSLNGSMKVIFNEEYNDTSVLYEIVAWNTYQENSVTHLITVHMVSASAIKAKDAVAVYQNPNYIDNALRSISIPILGGPFYFSNKSEFSINDPANIIIQRNKIHTSGDPLANSQLIISEILTSESQAYAKAAQWKSETGLNAVLFYYGAGGYIYPTIISRTTAPKVTNAAEYAIEDERQYAEQAQETGWALLWWYIGARVPFKAKEPLPPSSNLKLALGESTYTQLAHEARTIQSANASLAKLTIDEIIAIRAYTSESWAIINAALRSQQSSAQAQTLIKLMISGLKKLPGFSGKVVRSEARSVVEALKEYKEGTVIVKQAFTSTGKGAAAAQREGNVALTIIANGKNGRDIAAISKHSLENEVLFLPGAKFLVEKVVRVGNAFLVTLKEL